MFLIQCVFNERFFFSEYFFNYLPQDHLPTFPLSSPICLFFFCVTKGALKHLDNLQFAKVTYYLVDEISPCDNFCGTQL